MKIKFLAIIIMLHTRCFADNVNLEDIYRPQDFGLISDKDSPEKKQPNDNGKTDPSSLNTNNIFNPNLSPFNINDQAFDKNEPWDK